MSHTTRLTGAMSHCRACRITFKSVSGFDAHRVGPPEQRRCLSTDELAAKGYAPDSRGLWRQPFDRAALHRDAIEEVGT